MLCALLTDIHANREAFSACLAHARAAGAQRYLFLGDYVGYGAEPGWVLDTVMSQVAQGAIALLGNHDAAALDQDAGMNEIARAAIVWTRDQLAPRHYDFLRTLPLAHEENGCLFVHANAWAPERWGYVTGPAAAARSLTATQHRITFCGHVHVPRLYHLTAAGAVASVMPTAGPVVPLAAQRRWLAVIGSVGQPRDGSADAAYALFDDALGTLRYLRVSYDVDTAARKIIAAGLPEVLGLRLLQGQ